MYTIVIYYKDGTSERLEKLNMWYINQFYKEIWTNEQFLTIARSETHKTVINKDTIKVFDVYGEDD